MSMGFRHITNIRGYAINRIPRLGKIHLGVKAQTAAGKEYPTETTYFVCPPEVAQVYGDKPTELDFYFPAEADGEVAPVAFKKYRGAGLECKGDGEIFSRRVGDAIEEGRCPGPEACEFAWSHDKAGRNRCDCKAIMNLYIVLFRVSIGGVYQLDTGSWHSHQNVLGGLAYVRARNRGRITGIPLKLARVPQETQAGGKKALHYVLQVVIPSYEEIERLLPEAQRLQRLLQGVGVGAPGPAKLPVPHPGPREIEADLNRAEVVAEVVAAGGSTGEAPEAPLAFSDEEVDLETGEVVPPPTPPPVPERLPVTPTSPVKPTRLKKLIAGGNGAPAASLPPALPPAFAPEKAPLPGEGDFRL